jgi:hypothetical protein
MSHQRKLLFWWFIIILTIIWEIIDSILWIFIINKEIRTSTVKEDIFNFPHSIVTIVSNTDFSNKRFFDNVSLFFFRKISVLGIELFDLFKNSVGSDDFVGQINSKEKSSFEEIDSGFISVVDEEVSTLD